VVSLFRERKKRKTQYSLCFDFGRKNKMRITTFFKKILKLIGTIVESAHVNSSTDKEKHGKIVIRVRPKKKNLRCGQCGRKAEGRHGKKGKLRWWRDLGIRQIPVYLVCRIYRIRCKKCGVKTMQVP